VAQVAVAITPLPGSNYVAIVDEFYKRVEQIKKDLPEDLRYNVALDTTIGIRKAILEVEETILIAFGLVVLIIFIFLRELAHHLDPGAGDPDLADRIVLHHVRVRLQHQHPHAAGHRALHRDRGG
jgi:hypothetical protein